MPRSKPAVILATAFAVLNQPFLPHFYFYFYLFIADAVFFNS
jgi:hypothetical protein